MHRVRRMCSTRSTRTPPAALAAALPIAFAVGLAGCASGSGSASGAGPMDLPAITATPPLAPADTALDEPPPIEAGQTPPPGPYAPGFDALHYEIVLSLPDRGSRIRGRTTATIALVEPATDTLALDLTGLAVLRTRVDNRSTDARYDDGRLHIPVPAARAPGDTIVVEVEYAGEPDDGLIIGENLHGDRTAYADNWPNRARFWFPSIDHPSDKATAAFVVSAPAGWRVIANGRLIDSPEEAESARRGTWRWATDIPIPTYTMVVGAGEMSVGRIGDMCEAESGRRVSAAAVRAPTAPVAGADDCVPHTFWVFPRDSARGAAAFDRADEMVALYGELFAPFPYEKLAHVQSSTRFGGMENSSAIFYSEQAVARGGDIDGLVAHETAHQWFGDAVTEASWNHLWLSEGFATYFSAVFFEHADGIERFREVMENERREYAESDIVDRPIVDPDAANLFALLNDNNYEKGAWVLHMLRGLVGDDAFYDGLRGYYHTHLHGTALTADLQRAMERASGRQLGWFFDQWVFRPGFPRLRTDWHWDAAAGAAEVTIEQVQRETWPAFRTPLTLEFETPDGPVRRTVRLDARRHTFRIELPAAPTAVRVDPDGWLLKDVVD